MLGRRLITIPAFISGNLLVTGLLPALIAVAFVLRAFPATRTITRRGRARTTR